MEISAPVVKTVATHVGTMIGGATMMMAFASSHSVDLYAAWNQLNTVVADITKFVAMVTPLCTMAYAGYRTMLKNRLPEAVNTPGAEQVAAAMPVTQQATVVANALKGTNQ